MSESTRRHPLTFTFNGHAAVALEELARRRGLSLHETLWRVILEALPDHPHRWPSQAQSRAHEAVARAVRSGRLPHPNTVPCFDCSAEWKDGDSRHEYDHVMGYAREHRLAVHALCSACHRRRTAATYKKFGLSRNGFRGNGFRGA